ncbi:MULTISPECIES: outer membrane lipoprotein carrier protein LolA [unclassified Neisseria]|uniref:LolA family protein n=1 Tax=unclassified Neisseria TaxID=2623750 RepID=UPI002666F327|nr:MULTISPECIES: outer membrane lipoprotein carrier protein LolA [unclassified Neisseria]MDO1509343.1 outer membrane lipoprotein carrier protein LolA [Neisseria sp. MVDL19-042950]MDO1515378.1 outer membrane lipoprotein carrier protein LolA [Neisseria sp. MVDL18-041461]MDO1562738.1 outer membrane lipoprotein carrier protein LolA [Neisseria sp. MVDL20-010259]
MRKLIFTAALSLFSPLIWAFGTADLAQTLQKPDNVQGAFTQQRYLKSLTKPMTTNGRFVLLPKKGLLWHMQKPFDNRLRVRSDGITQWNGKNWTTANPSKMSGQSQQIKLFLDLLGGNTTGLEKQFNLQLSGTQQKWMLRLDPKTALMKQIFTRIDISGDNVVRRIELDEKQGDKTVMLFENVKTGQTLDEFAKQALQ